MSKNRIESTFDEAVPTDLPSTNGRPLKSLRHTDTYRYRDDSSEMVPREPVQTVSKELSEKGPRDGRPSAGNEFQQGSEGADLALDDHIGDFIHIVEPFGGNGFGLGLPGGQLGVVLRIGEHDLDRSIQRLGDRLSDLGE